MSGEDTVSALFRALIIAQTAAATKAAELRATAGWSEVTSEVGFGLSQGDGFWVGGFVDGELAGFGGVSWTFDLWRSGSGWDVTRSLNANVTSEQETVAELPKQEYADSLELAGALPRLVGELLTVEAPVPSP